MGRDFLIYARFKARLRKIALLRSASGFFFSDLLEDRGLMDRLYQIYVVGIGVAWLALMWSFLLDTTTDLFSSMGAAATQAIVQLSLLVPFGLFAVMAMKYARSSPWKMSHPDIAYVAASPLSTAAIILWEILNRLVVWGIAGFLMGYLLGVGFESGTGADADPLPFAALGALACLCAVVGAWAVGVVRLAIPRRKNWAYFASVCCGLVLVVAAASAAVLLGAAPVEAALSPLSLAAAAVLVIAGLSFLVLASGRVDTVRAIQENALYADLYNLRHMPLYDASGYAEIQRQKHVANRPPLLSLRMAGGANALFTRSLLSHVRQFEGIPHIAFWGAVAAPTTAFLLLVAQTPLLWMAWATVLLIMPQGVREMTRPFRDDLRNRAVSDHLSISTLRLFVGESAIGFVLCAAVSTAVALLTGLLGEPLLAVAACLVANVALALCAGIDGLPFFQSEKAMSYELAVLILIAGVFFTVAIAGNPALPLGFLLVYSLVLVLSLKYG